MNQSRSLFPFDMLFAKVKYKPSGNEIKSIALLNRRQINHDFSMSLSHELARNLCWKTPFSLAQSRQFSCSYLWNFLDFFFVFYFFRSIRKWMAFTRIAHIRMRVFFILLLLFIYYECFVFSSQPRMCRLNVCVCVCHKRIMCTLCVHMFVMQFSAEKN